MSSHFKETSINKQSGILSGNPDLEIKTSNVRWHTNRWCIQRPPPPHLLQDHVPPCVETMYWGLDHGQMNLWCQFEKDPLKTKGCTAQRRKVKLALK